MNRIGLASLALLIVLTGSGSVSAFASPVHSLLDQATSKTDASDSNAYAHHTFGFYWLSDKNVLFSKRRPGGKQDILSP